MKVKNHIIIKDNFFDEKTLKKIQHELSHLNFTNRSLSVDKNNNNSNQLTYFNVDLDVNHFAVKEVLKNLKYYFNKDIYPCANFYFLSGKHTKSTTHIDKNTFNCLIYLKGKYLINSGTGFYDYNEDKDISTLNTHVGFKENRAIIFDAKIYHASLQFNENCGSRFAMANFFNYDSS